MEKKFGLQHGCEGGHHKRKMLGKATRHDGIDGQLLCGDHPFADGFSTYEML
jgi:hypothetical protein